MNQNNEKKLRVVIAGGGTAGWMAAAALAKNFGKVIDLTLIESDEIGTVGVGEATIPTLHTFHQLLGVKENEVMAATNATFKLGIMFENWHDRGKNYLHSFGNIGRDQWAAQFHHFWLKGAQKNIVQPIGDYCVEHLAARENRFAVYPNQELNHAYHMDATLYAKFLRRFAEPLGAKRIEGKITEVKLNNENGFIQSLVLNSGVVLEGDLFIDCTGFSALLIEKALHTGYEDWSHWLPCDRAIAVQTESVESEFVPYTRSIAHESGWQWRIPLQTRTGNGFVYCSKYMTEDQAINLLTNNVEGKMINTPRVIPFRTGTRRKHWNKNCVAIGLSSGFLEPLESTSIHLIQKSIIQLMLLLPAGEIKQSHADEFNNVLKTHINNIKDFVIAHYHVTDRADTPFWRYCRAMEIPTSLKQRIDLFKESGQIYKYESELFGYVSWIQVLMGQGVMPKSYHPFVDTISDEELQAFLNRTKIGVYQKVLDMPNHKEFIQVYCKSTPMNSEQVEVQELDFPVNQSAAVKVREIGHSKTPLISVDTFAPQAIKNLFETAKKNIFNLDSKTFYPGMRTPLPKIYVTSVLAFLEPVLRKTYNVPDDYKLTVIQADFSMLTLQESALAENQCVPHADGLQPYAYAVLHYLSPGVHGGTGFFRHRPTGFEKINHENKFEYYDQKEAYFKQHGRPPKKYMTESNDHYELYDKIDYQQDRLAAYPGMILHSGLVKLDKDISVDIDKGRLTANIFINFVPASEVEV